MKLRKFTLVAGFTLALVACLGLAACSGSGSGSSSSASSSASSAPAPATTFTITNNVGERIGSIYINSSTNDNWGDPIYQGLDHKASQEFSYEKICGNITGTVDVGTIDNTGMNRDFYEVTLLAGDALEITASGATAKLIVIHADGSRDTYEGRCYQEGSQDVGNDSLTVVNSTGATIAVYINSSSNENWGDKVCDPIANGSARALSYSEIIGTDTGTFDVGTIDANGMNRDFYGITFFEDDVMEITANGNTAKLVVTHTDGSRDTYDGQCYTD